MQFCFKYRVVRVFIDVFFDMSLGHYCWHYGGLQCLKTTSDFPMVYSCLIVSYYISVFYILITIFLKAVIYCRKISFKYKILTSLYIVLCMNFVKFSTAVNYYFLYSGMNVMNRGFNGFVLFVYQLRYRPNFEYVKLLFGE